MSRTSMGIVAGLIVLGCVVAMLPAQESSRRTASKYRPTTNGAPGERPSLAPLNPAEADLPPIVAPPGRPAPSSTRSSFVPGEQQLEATSGGQSPSGMAVPQDPTATQPASSSAAATTADSAAAELDDSRLHSVL